VSVKLPEGDSAHERQKTPSTLTEAHALLRRLRPAQDADPSEWVKFHRHCARVYGQVAKVDRRHQHEAAQCAGLEIRKARDIEYQLNPGLDGGDG
jgi:hypothetical protein